MAKLATLIDNFNDNSFDTGLWVKTGGTHVAETNQEMEITKAAGADYETIDSAAAYDLTASSIYAQVKNAGDQTNASNEMYPVRLYNSVDGTDSIEWGIFNGVLKAFYKVNGSTTTVLGTTNYSFATHKWFRIREASGVIYWEFSTDGSSWTEYTHVTTPVGVDITSLKVSLSVGSWDVAASTVAIWDNINTSGVVSTGTGIDTGQLNNPSFKERSSIRVKAGITGATLSGYDLKKLYYAGDNKMLSQGDATRAFLQSQTSSTTRSLTDLWREYFVFKGVPNQVSLSDMAEYFFINIGF